MTETLNHHVAANIRAETARRRMSQQEFADLLAITRPTAAAILHGTTALTLERIEEIAAGLKVDPIKLITG